MSSKNETPVLIAALLITAGLLGGGYWWLSRDGGGFNLGSITGANPSVSENDPNGASSNGSNTGALSNGDTTTDGFAQVANVPAGLFNYGGSTTWAPLRSTVDAAIQQAHPELQLRYTDPIGAPPGSGYGD
jgi:phosphate transport system substrate-binding protein